MTASPPKLPDFPDSVRWLDRPPLWRTTALRGHVVLMLFWRLGCVHSRQALAEVASLAEEWSGQPLAVLAAHVPLHAAECDLERVRRTVAQLPFPVTVLLDVERDLCRALAIAALPSIVLADADGGLCFSGRGEPNRLRLNDAIEALLAMARERGDVARMTLAPVLPSGMPGPVPTAIAVAGERLWVADAGHRRVYAATTAGEVLQTVAGFVTPLGLCQHGDRMLVADGGAHRLRSIDVETGAVETVLGTGKRSTDRFGGGYGEHQGLCSPIGLCSQDGAVYIAQAGAHQIWQFDPATQAASAWLGTGSRTLRDGGEQAAFTEPHGIAASDRALFVADAGNGAVRAVELAHTFVRTVAQGLVRPTAVVVHGEHLLVAASWQPAVLRMSSAGVGGEPEVLCDATHGLVEPVGLAMQGSVLWIADAGAGCLFAVDLAVDPAVAVEAPRSVRRVDLRALPPIELPPLPDYVALLAEPIAVPEYCDVTFHIHLPCAPGEHVDPSARCEVDLCDEASPVLAADRHAVAEIEDGHAVVLVPIAERGQGALRVRVQAMVRRSSEPDLVRRVFRFLVPVSVGNGGGLTAAVRAVSRRSGP